MSLERNDCHKYKNLSNVQAAQLSYDNNGYKNCKQRNGRFGDFFKHSNDVVQSGAMDLVNYKSHLCNTYMQYLVNLR